jgi:hypothetical protein
MQTEPLQDQTTAPAGDSAERLARSRADIARWLDGHASPPDALRPGLPVQAAQLALGAAAHRHPWGLMGTAVATGAVLTLARPWRWLFRPGLLLAVASPLVSELASRWLHQAVSGVAAAPPSMAPDTDPRLPKAPLQ